ncbi:hypothetical protein BU24DRAFT_357605 [Aaosphaeria arxii CBS 175.79]|uniref:Xylanolytic transcriptional activator regulatory domain-containing protein n=1 Tax=Aaosphaeria arxii CBS 175.79 TaxID=1450172 RepID=A0A6A5XBD1_9PLEO|nr:uncharacterized protein BU24DRAFT_357605 [Aaosphaeria arxii CBS 175.79]KAF2010107.1 hypothetical protein BU24DRAFT_357605 [Aaosphaeria arxii CBS 175.79]
MSSTPQTVSRIVVASNGASSYHGRTSTLFDENPHDRANTETRPRMPDEWVEKGLVAEAARQRQLEEVNFRLGKLDFDGVEPDLGMHLLSLHWNRQHHSFLTTYRPAFMRDMACGGPYFSKLLLNAIYFGASKFSPRHEVRRVADDVRTAGWQFRQRVRELLGGALDKSEVTTIQALLVMTNSLFALGDERSAAWLYAGLAFRMIVDLGMHVDTVDLASTRKFSDEDYEIRRRVFWAAFVVDKIQSLYQGRPVSIKESDTLVPIKFLDTYEELENWSPFAYSTQSSSTYQGSPAYSITTFQHLCKLSVILSDILSTIYTERTFDSSPGELSAKLESIHSKLTTWHSHLPAHLAVDVKKEPITPPPHVLSLHAMYNVLMILLHRPFVADGHLYSTSRSISVNSFIACATAAENIVDLLRVYDKAFSVRRAPYLISYATYVAATIHARIAAKRGIGSNAHSNLKACLAVFRENQETNWAVRRANAIVQNLMKRLGVDIPSPDETRIDRDNGGNSQSSTPGTSTSRSMAREPSLHSLDIDGIIQSFVREQETMQVPQASQSGRNMSSDATFPAQQMWSFPSTEVQGVGPQSENQDTNTLAYETDSSWLYQGQQQPFGEVSISVDDLLYGFNGSALDSFPILDGTMM